METQEPTQVAEETSSKRDRDENEEIALPVEYTPRKSRKGTPVRLEVLADNTTDERVQTNGESVEVIEEEEEGEDTGSTEHHGRFSNFKMRVIHNLTEYFASIKKNYPNIFLTLVIRNISGNVLNHKRDEQYFCTLLANAASDDGCIEAHAAVYDRIVKITSLPEDDSEDWQKRLDEFCTKTLYGDSTNQW